MELSERIRETPWQRDRWEWNEAALSKIVIEDFSMLDSELAND